MNTGDINIKAIPSIKNYRTLDRCFSIDDSGFNIAICDVLHERDFLLEESAELGIPVTPFSVPSCTTDNPIDWAHAIRQHYAVDLKDQYRCTSSRKLYLYLREKLERKGVFVQCFTDVPVEIVRGFAIYEHELPIIGINDDDVGNWLGSKQCASLPIDDEIQRNVRRIVTEHLKMISFSGGKGSSSGDAFLIATAMKYNLTIIIEEKKDKQNKIPNICKDYGIQTMSITELCVAEGWVF